MGILDENFDIKFLLGDYYEILDEFIVNVGVEEYDALISGILKIELTEDFKIQTKKVRQVVRRILGETYCVKRISLPSSWRFECCPREHKGLKKYLWCVPGSVEFYISKEIHLP